MSNRILLIALASSALLAGCADLTGPPPDIADAPMATAADGTLHPLQWNLAQGAAVFAVDDAMPSDLFLMGGVPAHSRSPLPVETYEVSFWAVRGQKRFVEVNYLNCPLNEAGGDDDGGDDDDGEDDDGDDDEDDGKKKKKKKSEDVCPFLRLKIPKSALNRLSDGSYIAKGDSVLITVSISTSQILVDLEPSGLVFDSPAELEIWYGGADPDFNGDGVVDKEDERIERELLKFWHQDEHGGPWHAMKAKHSTKKKHFKVKLPHFSGYAVSW
jgi:hypothetical protein